jgi:hypothetical protein
MTMTTFWTTVLTVISTIAAVLGVGVGIFVFVQGRSEQSKKLEVELISQSTLVDERVHGGKQRIVILYDNRPIPNYGIFQFRVVNTGGQPIRDTDYAEPLVLSFENVSEILSAEQVSSDPKDLTITPLLNPPTPTPQTPKAVWLSKALLNPRDWYTVEVGVTPESGKKPTVAPKGRIAGVKKIEYRDSISEPKKEQLVPFASSVPTNLLVAMSIAATVAGVSGLIKAFF